MLFSDCRNDDYYNADFLTESDTQFVGGFDWTVETVDHLFDNLDCMEDGSEPIQELFETELPDDLKSEYTIDFTFQNPPSEERTVETYGDFFRMQLLAWLEAARNELITSMVDDMDEDLYKAVRNKVLRDNALSEHPKEYYDTRKYLYSGKKESDGIDDDED